MYLESVDNVMCKDDISLEEFLSISRDVLRRGGVDETVVIDGGSRRVVKNSKLCAVLKRIGVKFIPISYGVSEKVFISLEDLGFSMILNLVGLGYSWIQRNFSTRIGRHL